MQGQEEGAGGGILLEHDPESSTQTLPSEQALPKGAVVGRGMEEQEEGAGSGVLPEHEGLALKRVQQQLVRQEGAGGGARDGGVLPEHAGLVVKQQQLALAHPGVGARGVRGKRGGVSAAARAARVSHNRKTLQGYLAHKKMQPLRNLP